MKKSILIFTLVLLVLFMVGCENTENPFQSENQITGERSLAKKGGNEGGEAKVEICHRKGNGDYITIMVATSAVQAHLNHGDIRTMLSGEWEISHDDYNPPAVFLYNFDDWDGLHPALGDIVTITINTVSCDGPTIYFEMTFPAGNDTYTVKYTGYYTGEGKMAGTRDVFKNSGLVRDDGPWTAERML